MREIITSEEVVSAGKPFPPLLTQYRLERYSKDLIKYDGDYNKGKYIRVKNVKTGKLENYPIITSNFYKLIVLKLLSLLMNERFEPHHTKEGVITNLLTTTITNSRFWEEFPLSYTSYRSLGTGGLYLSNDGGKPTVNNLNPQNIIKVVDEGNISNIKSYILTQPLYKQDYTKDIQDKAKYLRVMYHYIGYYVEKVYEYDGISKLGNAVDYTYGGTFIPKDGLEVPTGLSDFAVFLYENHPPMGSVYGVSDFEDITDMVAIYEQVMTLIDVVLVKNINPLIQLPEGVMKGNEFTGEMEAVGPGDSVEVRKEDKDIKFITYDMQIQDTISYIDKVLSNIGIQSEMSLPFLTGEFPSNLSGEAIKNLMKSPLDKTSRSIDTIDPVLKRLFTQMLRLKGVEVDVSDIGIDWKDGIATTDD